LTHRILATHNGIIHRIWPGTQRHLLWADPAIGAGYGRAFSLSGSFGVELFEPLSFKGRMGSGMPGGRNAYLDKSLDPKYDWEKFSYDYRLWDVCRTIPIPTPRPGGGTCDTSFTMRHNPWRRRHGAHGFDDGDPSTNCTRRLGQLAPSVTETARGERRTKL
jgi:hypothetical protein